MEQENKTENPNILNTEPTIEMAKDFTKRMITANGQNSARSTNMLANAINSALYQ